MKHEKKRDDHFSLIFSRFTLNLFFGTEYDLMLESTYVINAQGAVIHIMTTLLDNHFVILRAPAK